MDDETHQHQSEALQSSSKWIRSESDSSNCDRTFLMLTVLVALARSWTAAHQRLLQQLSDIPVVSF